MSFLHENLCLHVSRGAIPIWLFKLFNNSSRSLAFDSFLVINFVNSSPSLYGFEGLFFPFFVLVIDVSPFETSTTVLQWFQPGFYWYLDSCFSVYSMFFLMSYQNSTVRLVWSNIQFRLNFRPISVDFHLHLILVFPILQSFGFSHYVFEVSEPYFFACQYNCFLLLPSFFFFLLIYITLQRPSCFFLDCHFAGHSCLGSHLGMLPIARFTSLFSFGPAQFFLYSLHQFFLFFLFVG